MAGDGLSLRALSRVRDRIGPRAALALALARAETLSAGEERLRTLEVALESAFLAGDDGAVTALARRWPLEAPPRPSAVAASIARALGARGSAHAAREIARAEAARSGSGAAHVVLAALLEDAGELDAALASLEAARRSPDERAAERAELETLRIARARGVVDAALVRQAVDRLGRPGLRARDRLVVAGAALVSPSRYDRALALDELVCVARNDAAPAARTRALRLGLEHADGAGARLSALELDRLTVLVEAALPPGAPRADLEAELVARGGAEGSPERLALLDPDDARRARGALAGAGAGPRPEAAPRVRAWLPLAALAALEAGRDAEAAALVDELVADGAPAPAWWLVAARMAERAPLAAHLERAVAHLVGSGTAPPRALTEIAAHLERHGHEAPALAAHRAAHAAGERGAREGLVLALVRAGWRAAEAGRRDRAIELLREARARSGGAPPA